MLCTHTPELVKAKIKSKECRSFVPNTFWTIAGPVTSLSSRAGRITYGKKQDEYLSGSHNGQLYLIENHRKSR